VADRQLVTIEIRFKTEEDPAQLAERIKESVRMITGEVEEFRVRTLPLTERKGPRPVE
jgi:acetylornithine deacetylase/succinyl-diaminopimelate desuccinylase-like protein